MILGIFETVKIINSLNSLDLKKRKDEIEKRVSEFYKVKKSDFNENSKSFQIISELKDGREITFEFHTRMKNMPAPATIIKLESNDKDFNIVLTTETGIIVKIAKLLWLKDNEIGVHDFDKKYIIRSNNNEKCKKFLSEKVRNALIPFYDLKGTYQFQFIIQNGKISIINNGILEVDHIKYYMDLINAII